MFQTGRKLLFCALRKRKWISKLRFFFSLGCPVVIITLGHRGSYLRTKDMACAFPAAAFPSVDSTGGADAFIAALASYLTEGCPLEKAIPHCHLCRWILRFQNRGCSCPCRQSVSGKPYPHCRTGTIKLSSIKELALLRMLQATATEVHLQAAHGPLHSGCVR